MIKLISFGSSSKGNCHVLYNGSSSLMLDCGINFRKKSYLVDEYNLQGILVSHRHGDHCNGLKTYLGSEKVYGNSDVIDHIKNDISNGRKNIMVEYEKYSIGDDWIVVPVKLIHDVPNFGFVIKDKKSGLNFFYGTDMGYSENLKIKGINVWIIEANYIASEIEEMIVNSQRGDEVKISRVLSDKGHLSLEESVEMVSRNASNDTIAILLAHISASERNFGRYATIYKEKLITCDSKAKNAHVFAIDNKINVPEEIVIVEDENIEDLEMI